MKNVRLSILFLTLAALGCDPGVSIPDSTVSVDAQADLIPSADSEVSVDASDVTTDADATTDAIEVGMDAPADGG